MMRVFVLQKILYSEEKKEKKKMGKHDPTYHSTGQVRVDTFFFYKFISG